MTNALTCPVFLVGFMGAGKTSTARRIARICGIMSVDVDIYLERCEGKHIKDIFDERGEDGFRALETRVLHEIVEKEPMLVSCGGGVIKRQENRVFMKRVGFVIYLKVEADEARARISNLSTRPLFRDVETARQIVKERVPFYEEIADAVIDTAGKNVKSIACEVQTILEKESILCLQQR